jgi:transient receptor potential cation channel subfamily M protein 3
VSYHPHSFSPKGRFAVLNNRHSFFLLVDNGTVGRYGADIVLRRRLESYIAEKQKIGGSVGRSVPVVCVILEGGTCTVRTVLDYVTNIPRVPVVVCDGSGRASDLIAFAHQYIQEDGNLPEGVRPQLLSLIESVFGYDKQSAQCLILDILACVRQKHLITVFRLGENQKQDVDYAILTALLKGHNLSAPEQLLLALAWNRVDIARSDIFIMGQDWPKAALHNAMMDALIHNRVDFVRLLLENGVSMHDFLTIGRLEELYNTDQGPPNTLYYIVRDVVKIRTGYRYKLPHIGLAVEKLMANGFRSHYTSTEFRRKYTAYRNRRKEMFHREKSGRSGSEFFSPTMGSMLPVGSASHLQDKDATFVPAISGSRALSNHILWRSAFRRENYGQATMMSGANLAQAQEAIVDLEDGNYCLPLLTTPP